MTSQEQVIADIAREVVARLRAQMQQQPAAGRPSSPSSAARDGVFATVDEAANAADAAAKKVGEMSLEDRGRMIAIVRRICIDRADELGRMELEESKVGRLDHKIQKLKNMQYVVGVEGMRSEARTDTSGLCLIEHAPWGAIGMVLPVTHSVPTMAANAINILAAGNTALFAPHPSAKRVAQYALQLFNREIERELGVANALTTILEPSIEAADQIFQHPKIALLCVTGGPMVVKAAGKYGKRVIAAGPGNPPVVVDETADLAAAAKDIILGGRSTITCCASARRKCLSWRRCSASSCGRCIVRAGSNWIGLRLRD
jgi:aldehyde dehydrogenase